MPNRNPLLSLGFRPFFLAAGVSGCLSLLIWLAMLQLAARVDGRPI